MSKEEMIKTNGVVLEALRGTKFKVKTKEGHDVIVTLAGRLRKNNIRIIPGDNVGIELSPYDLSKGRIVYRNKKENTQ